jgi:aminoglycoside phosphotransferase (APT) family kinase protein
VTDLVAQTAEDELARRLDSWAGEFLPGAGSLQVRRLAAGHSNLTFLLRRSGSDFEWVLRRPPFGPLLPSAHDVLREYRVVRALEGSGVRLPVVVAACEDPAVLGAPFYVMERSPGEVVRTALPDWLTADKRAVLGRDLVVALAELHAAPVAPLVSAGLGREGGYVGRQLRRWQGQREGVRAYTAEAGLTARELPDYDWVRDWLIANQPSAEQPSAVVHGDYKLDNALVDPASATVTALLDWEMATVGDPLADLGYLLYMSPRPGDPAVFPELTGDVTAASGFPTREEIVGIYASAASRDLGALGFYEVLAGWKIAVLLEASYWRWRAGTSDDPLFPTLDWGVPALLARARALAEGEL